MSEDISDLLIAMGKKHPYYRLLGIEVKEAKNGKSRLEVEVTEELLQLFGTIHGGVFASMIDAAAGIAIYSQLFKKDRVAVTVEIKVNFYSSVTEGKMIAKGKVEHLGSNTVTCKVRIQNKGNLVASGIATFYVLDEEKSEKMLQKAREAAQIEE